MPRMTASGLLPALPPALSLLTAPGVRATTAERGTGDRWLNGLAIEPEACALNLDGVTGSPENDIPYWWECLGAGGASPASTFGPNTKAIDDGGAAIESDAWTAWVGYACSALGFTAARQAEAEGMVRRRLIASLSAIVEYELWTGQVATAAGFPNPFLSDTPTDLGDYPIVLALAELEQALAACVSVGQKMIHAQPRVVTAWKSLNLVSLSPDRTHLLTELGTVVVPGAGYPGTNEANGGSPDDDNSWAFGTGQVKVFVNEPRTSQVDATTVTRPTNDIELRAEVDVLTIFNPCCVRMVGVDLTAAYAAGP